MTRKERADKNWTDVWQKDKAKRRDNALKIGSGIILGSGITIGWILIAKKLSQL